MLGGSASSALGQSALGQVRYALTGQKNQAHEGSQPNVATRMLGGHSSGCLTQGQSACCAAPETIVKRPAVPSHAFKTQLCMFIWFASLFKDSTGLTEKQPALLDLHQKNTERPHCSTKDET